MKIMIGYDSSNAAREAVKLGIQHAKAFDASIAVITSLEGGSETEGVEIKNAEEDLEESRGLIEKEGIACDVHLLVQGNSPGEDIVQFAKENNVDEIIIGVRKKSKVGKLLFGSNAQYVIVKAHCPVVAVK